MEGNNQNRKWGKDLGHNSRGESWNQFSNPKFISSQSSQHIPFKEPDSWRNIDSGVLTNEDSSYGPTNLILEENVPLVNLEGKKHQRVMEGLLTATENKMDTGILDLTASSREQSSRMQ
ncbi:hypothetical protein PVK06_021699 [Gossypium arboreum]|uniref:Uncharacterized protein n=1 Tax=Gossypium arboreum TaxID=29729 RepID=A0ABR0PQR4_GOSAR|nr:hypothetical protein PVK06_021699 [Gossypium arboreum]